MPEPDTVVVVDTGFGNIASVLNMLRRLRVAAERTANPHLISKADRIILPGVGAFDPGMSRLAQLGLIDPLRTAVLQRRVPILGICLGMQLLTDGSEEGSVPGLGLIAGRAVRIPVSGAESLEYKLPHMGWNRLEIIRSGGLYAGHMDDPRFYFVHSYHVLPKDRRHVTATTQHGSAIVTASIQCDNIVGAQFHPEKSHRYGLWLMGNFLGIRAC